jgi:hypothetical protein
VDVGRRIEKRLGLGVVSTCAPVQVSTQRFRNSSGPVDVGRRRRRLLRYVDARPLRTSFLARTAWQVDPTDFSCVLLGVPNYPYDTLRHQPTYLPTLIPTDLRTFTSHHSSYSIEGADIEMRDAETSRWGMEKVKEVALYIYSINVLIVRPGMIH